MIVFGSVPDEPELGDLERGKFRLTRVIRRPSDDLSLALDGSMGSNDERVELGLTFDSLDDARVAAIVLRCLMAKDYAPWLGGDEHPPLIEVTEKEGHITRILRSRHQLDFMVPLFLEMLGRASKALDDAVDDAAQRADPDWNPFELK